MIVTAEQRCRVVVVGAGYAGTMAAIRLVGRRRSRVRVTLINPTPTFVQRLRLHEVAAGRDVAAPSLTSLVGRRRIELVTGNALGIDLAGGWVELAGERGAERLGYDRLILACGSTIDLGAPGCAEHAHALCDLASAVRLRAAFAVLAKGARISVIGGGMTGLEVASELAGARPDVRVGLLTGGALGGWLSDRGRGYLAGSMARLGIDITADSRVTSVEARRLLLADGSELPFDLAVWCGGFVARPLAAQSGLAVDERGGAVVDPELRSVSNPTVLAVGDAAALPRQPNGAVVRWTCQAGMPTGAHAADTVAAELAGRTPKPFRFGYIHQPISLGRRDGLIQWVDRADVVKPGVLTGRRAAVYKNLVSAAAITSLRMERRVAGSTRWPGPGRAVADVSPARRVAETPCDE